MIDYLSYTQSPDRQLMAEALRGTTASGGTPAVTPSTSMSSAASGNSQMWGNNVAQQQQQGADLSSFAKMGGKWLAQPSSTGGQSNLQSGLSSLSGMFGGGGGSAVTQAPASVVSRGGGSGVINSAGGSGGSMFGGMSGGLMGIADNMFGDKFYGKQEGSDEYEEGGGKAAAKSALTTAAYSNPWTAAALWADRLLFKGKVMDSISGLFD